MPGHPAQVWAIPPEGMQCDWLGERVATVDVTRAITNVLHNKEDAGWGPNAVFRFPLEGGTGGIWKAVAAKLPQDRLVSISMIMRQMLKGSAHWVLLKCRLGHPAAVQGGLQLHASS